MPLTRERTSPNSCWSCNKRRVRCDATKPFCHRCRNDGIECPGDTKPLVWMNGPSRARRSNKEQAVTKKPREGKPSPPSTLARCLDAPGARTHHLVLDGVAYWNDNILPVNMPAHAPFRRGDFVTPVEPHPFGVLDKLFLVTCWTIRDTRNGKDALQNDKILEYRSQALCDLNRMLPTALVDTSGLALACMIMLAIADFELAQHDAWLLHLGATRKAIQCRGGFQACVDRGSAWASLYQTFVVCDILLSTVQQATAIDEHTLTTQAGYLPLLPKLERRLILNGDGAPSTILDAIIRTTALRAEFRQSKSRFALSQALQEGLLDVHCRIRAFDPESWASQAANYGLARPQRLKEQASERCLSAWANLGGCWRLAALVYLTSSIPCGEGRARTIALVKTMHGLEQHLQELFDIASSDPDDPTEEQLWKFLNWPLLMMVRACRITGYPDTSALQRLGRIATATGIKSWANLADRIGPAFGSVESQSIHSMSCSNGDALDGSNHLHGALTIRTSLP